MVNQWHYAVAVGIDQYPGLRGNMRRLIYPKSDAEKMVAWLHEATGGGGPPGQATLITREEPPGRTMPVPLDDEIYEAITDQVDRFQEALRQIPSAAGREAAWKKSRFYLYLSGHGVDAEGNDAVVLAANSRARAPGFHVSARNILKHLKRDRVFAEVVVLVDACREQYARVINDAPFDFAPSEDLNFSDDVRCFFAVACKTGKRAFEPGDGCGIVNGIFTHALLTALRVGLAVGPVNADSLGACLEQSVPILADQCAGQKQNPDILERDREIRFQTAPNAGLRVRVTVPSGSRFAGIANLEAIVYYEGVVRARISLASLGDGSFEARLQVGLYSVLAADADPVGADTPPHPFSVIKDNMEIELP